MHAADLPPLTFVGYVPRRITPRRELKGQDGKIWLTNEAVEEICSVSECLAKAPEGWVDRWEHNALGFYDTERAAASVIPADRRQEYALFGYKMYPIQADQGRIVEAAIATTAQEALSRYTLIGFDVVSKSMADFFECSPLSCSGGCDDAFPVNRCCLLNDLEAAWQCYRRVVADIADERATTRPDGVLEWRGKWKPGPYYLFQVYRRLVADA